MAGAEAGGRKRRLGSQVCGQGSRRRELPLPSKVPRAVDLPRWQIRLQTRSATMETQRVSHGNPKQRYL